MIKIYSQIVSLLVLLLVFTNCKKDSDTFKLATLEITAIDSISQASLSVKAIVLTEGASLVTQRGVCWSTGSLPTVDAVFKEAGSGLGDFKLSVAPLLPNMTYYFRAYAKSLHGIAYSLEDTVTTLPLAIPVVVTGNAIEISQNSVIVNAEIADNGGTEITKKGVCWSLLSSPTINDSIAYTFSDDSIFQLQLSGLVVSTNYYYRSFAENSIGIGYGVVRQVATSGVAIPVHLSGNITSVDNVSALYTYSLKSTGGVDLITTGICYSTIGIPTLKDSLVYGKGNMFSFSASMMQLTGATTYYIRPFATNVAGVSFGDVDTLITLTPTLAKLCIGGITNISSRTADCDSL